MVGKKITCNVTNAQLRFDYQPPWKGEIGIIKAVRDHAGVRAKLQAKFQTTQGLAERFPKRLLTNLKKTYPGIVDDGACPCHKLLFYYGLNRNGNAIRRLKISNKVRSTQGEGLHSSLHMYF